MAHKVLFVEGDFKYPNEALLRQGFACLLGKLIIRKKLPAIKASGGKSTSINGFKKAIRTGEIAPCLLIDLDAPAANRDADLTAYKIATYSEVVFYMIQEMESWFISQPQILNDYFGVKDKGKTVAQKLGSMHYQNFTDPKASLKDATIDSHRGRYQETKHGVELLLLLDAHALYEADDDFKRLVDFINS